MTFGDALEALNGGRRIAREGWNGKGLFVFKQVPAEIPADVIPKMQSLPESVKAEFERRGGGIRYANQLALVDPSSLITGWSPSVSDALSKDWFVLPDAPVEVAA